MKREELSRPVCLWSIIRTRLEHLGFTLCIVSCVFLGQMSVIKMKQ